MFYSRLIHQASLWFITLFFSMGLTPLVQADTDCNAVTEISTLECQSLLELYNSTNGPNWKNNEFWNVTNTPCSWHGVTCHNGGITMLNLSDNQLTGTVPNFSGLPHLTWLSLYKNQLSGTLPNFSGLPHLTTLYLGANQLTGPLPDFSQLSALKKLNLSNNQLTGPLPDFNSLPHLTEISLTNNQLTGPLPNFSGLPLLENLYLKNNQLTGSIPNLSALPKLKTLELDNNQLTGPIPNFSRLANITALFLNNNQLTGSIPNFSGLPLEYLDLRNNLVCKNTDIDYATWPIKQAKRYDKTSWQEQLNEFPDCSSSNQASSEFCTGGSINVNNVSKNCNNNNCTSSGAKVTCNSESCQLCDAKNNCQKIRYNGMTSISEGTINCTHGQCNYSLKTGGSSSSGFFVCEGDSTSKANLSPTASYSASPTSGQVPLFFTLDASSSSDSDGSIVSYQWNITNNCTVSPCLPDPLKLTGKNVSVTLETAGNYSVTLVVTDDKGATDTKSSIIMVDNPNTEFEFCTGANVNINNVSKNCNNNNCTTSGARVTCNSESCQLCDAKNNCEKIRYNGMTSISGGTINCTHGQCNYSLKTGGSSSSGFFSCLSKVNQDFLTDCNAVTEISTLECQSLLELYNSTDGPNWINNESWNVTNTPCSWYGVTCENGGVIELDLVRNQLTGPIPDFSDLPHLTLLSIGGNQLTGPIPDFSGLPNLTLLNIGFNQLTGPIPNFTGLPKLEALWIYKNKLTGPIPDFSALPNLTSLILYQNKLTGPIPDFSGLSNLTSLALSDNQLTGPIPDFSGLPLEYLDLRNNLLCKNTGINYIAWGIKQAQHSDETSWQEQLHEFSECTLSNQSPVSVLELLVNGSPAPADGQSQIDLIVISRDESGNPQINIAIELLSDSDDVIIAKPTGITDMLGEFRTTVTVSEEVGRTLTETLVANITPIANGLVGQSVPVIFLPANTQIGIDCNAVTEISTLECQSLLELYSSTDGPNWINHAGWNVTNTPCSWYGVTCQNGGVTRLDLDENQVAGFLPDFSGLPALKILGLDNNQLTGPISDFSLPNLTILSLWGNQLTGTIPDFSGLPNLTELYLGANQLTGSIPDFSGLPNLTKLYLNNNELTGSIPDFTGLPNLTGFTFYSNKLTGPIPDFSNLPNLEFILLTGNKLTGSIPDFSNLPKLESLSVSFNELTGSIPNFSNLTHLTELNLSYNQLTGSIPDFSGLWYEGMNKISGPGGLPNLTSLDLSNNQLTGTIPDFSGSPKLTSLALSDNQLFGPIPDFSGLPLEYLDLRNNLLCKRTDIDYAAWSIKQAKSYDETSWQEQLNEFSECSDNQSPIAVFTVSQGKAPLTITLDASSSYDPDGSIVSYQWRLLKDCIVSPCLPDVLSLMGQIVSATLEKAGEYFITLIVVDDKGATDTIRDYSITVNQSTTDAQQFVGTWVNDDENTKGMTRIIIETEGSTMSVHGYGKCHPSDCDWGIVTVPYGNPFTAVYESGFKTNTLTIELVSENSLHVHSANIFHDGTNRDYEADYYFYLESVTNQPPTAEYYASPTNGEAPLTVTLDASPSTDSDGSIVSYQWSVNEKILMGKIVSVTLEETGNYPISLMVTDDKGATDSKTYTLTVTPTAMPKIRVEPTTTLDFDNAKELRKRLRNASDSQIEIHKTPGNQALFVDIGMPIEESPTEPTIHRFRKVEINLDALSQPDMTFGVVYTEKLILNLFPEAYYTVNNTSINYRGTDDYTWIGKIEGMPFGDVILVVKDGRITGNINAHGEVYRIRPSQNGLHSIQEMNPAGFPTENGPSMSSSLTMQPTPSFDDEQQRYQRRSARATRNGIAIIDVMVVYTPVAAQSPTKNEMDIVSEIQLAVDETNQAYANSGIKQKLRLVHTEQVNYTEMGDGDLDSLSNTKDSFLDEVHKLRDTYKADLVSLWVEEKKSPYCGVGWLMNHQSPSINFENRGFTVVKRDCATSPSYTFAHELGHNMGAHHATYEIIKKDGEVKPGSYNYSHGYVYAPQNNKTASWRTIMAYSEKCEAIYGEKYYSDSNWCTRIPYFSNPNIFCDFDLINDQTKEITTSCHGIPLGDNSANNALTLNNTADIVASFRESAELLAEETKTFTIYNDGNADLIVSSLSLENTALRGVTVIPTNTTVASGSSVVVKVTVNYAQVPTGETHNRLLVSSNDPNHTTYPIDLVINRQTDSGLNVADDSYDSNLNELSVTTSTFGGVYQAKLEPIKLLPEIIGSTFNFEGGIQVFGDFLDEQMTTYDPETGIVQIPIASTYLASGEPILFMLEMKETCLSGIFEVTNFTIIPVQAIE